MYIMLTRAVKCCTLWLHTEPLGYPGAQLTDDHADDDELSQHEKLVALTANTNTRCCCTSNKARMMVSSLRQTTTGSWAEIGGAPL
jgi:hypothetical protein